MSASTPITIDSYLKFKLISEFKPFKTNHAPKKYGHNFICKTPFYIQKIYFSIHLTVNNLQYRKPKLISQF